MPLVTEGSEQQALLARGLGVLDSLPSKETVKVGLLYVREGQTTEQQILANTSCAAAAGPPALHARRARADADARAWRPSAVAAGATSGCWRRSGCLCHCAATPAMRP